MTQGITWSKDETAALIELYRTMLELEAANELGRGSGQTTKAKLVREFLAEHSPEGRKKQSAEMKLMNISAAMQALGKPIVTGYKPLKNGAGAITTLIEENIK